MRLFTLFCLLVSVLKGSYSQETGTTLTEQVSVPYFANCLLIEKEIQPVLVYLPPSYYINTEKKYPVVYFLPGYGSSQSIGSMNNLIATGKTKEMIVVSPSSQSKLVGAFYVNSPLTGNWEDYITIDLVNYIDLHFRTIAKPEARALSGHSMGGFGALNLSMLHPDIFCIGYGMSPGLYDETGMSKAQVFSTLAKNKYFEFIELAKGLSREEAHTEYLDFIKTLFGVEDYIFSFAYGSAFSADTSLAAPYIKYPYTKNGDEIITDSTYLKNYENGFGNLKEKAKIYKDNLTKLKGYVIDYGTSDEYNWIVKGCIYFDKVLTDENIHHDYAPFSGTHSSRLSQRFNEFMIPYCDSLLEFDTAFFNTETKITGISMPKQVGDAVIDNNLKTVHIVVKATSDLTKIKPVITVIAGTKMTPESNVDTDFSSGSVAYTLVSEDGKTTANWTIYVSVDATSVNANALSTENIIYPNPASGNCYLNLNEPIIEIEVFDCKGNQVNAALNNDKTQLNVSNLAAGIYFVKITSTTKIVTSKFIVKK